MPGTALVTGATGFIGRRLVEALRQKGYSVRVLARSREKFHSLFGSEDSSLRLLDGDLTAEAAIRDGLRGATHLFHLAGLTAASRPEQLYRVNHLAARALYQTVRATAPAGLRVLHVSTLAAAGPSAFPEPPDGFPEPRPVSHYGKSKLLGEQEAWQLADRFPATVIRPPAVFGPGDREMLPFFRLVNRGIIPVAGHPRKRFSLLYVDDLARALLAAAESDRTAGNIYYPCYAEPAGWLELGRLAASILGRRGRQLSIPLLVFTTLAGINQWLAGLSGRQTRFNLEFAAELRQDYWVCSPASASRDFDFKPLRPLAEALTQTVSWYRDHGQLS